ncbi:hypothetical protein ACPV47_19665 [Vibrio jasicida]|uniref:hypothetical protein n=1 Tax=Vibrio jasicida TaxID=766224 RepID=UPI004067E432
MVEIGLQEELTNKLKDYYKLFNANGLFDLIILGLAAVSANFLSFIYYFDINALSLIDSGTVTKHVLIITLHYAGSLAAVSVGLLLFQHMMTSKEVLSFLGKSAPLSFSLEMLPRSLRLTLWNVLEKRTLRMILTISLFSIFYIGHINSLKLLGLSVLIVFVVSYLYLRFLGEESEHEKIQVLHLLGDSIKVEFPTMTITDEMKEKSQGYLVAKLGVIILYTALAVGIGRANYIEHNTGVIVAEHEEPLAVIGSSASGLLLYELNKKVVVFQPWSKVDSLSLPLERQKSLRKMNN